MFKGKKRNFLMTLAVVASLMALPLAFGCEAAPTEVAELEAEIEALEAEIEALEAEIEELTAPAEVIHWEMQHFGEPGTWYYENTGPPLADLIREMSDGRLDIKVYPSSAIVPNFELVSAVAAGTLDMCNVCPIYHTGLVPVANLEYGFPGQYRGLSDQRILLELGFMDILRDAYAEQGCYLVDVMTDAGLSIMMTKPIASLDDLRELTIRAGGGLAKVLEKAGVTVTMVPGPEIATSIATGIIDGVCYGGCATVMSLGVHEDAKYWLYPDLYGGHLCADILVNPDSWNALPDDLKAIVEAACKAFRDAEWDYAKYDDMRAMTEFVQEWGGHIVSLPEEDLAELTGYSVECMEELAAEEPTYCGPAVELILEYMEFMGY